MPRLSTAFLAASGLCISAAHAQVACNRPGGPDLVITDFMSPANFAAAGGIDAFYLGTRHANVGSAALSYTAASNQHPAFGLGLYRLSTVDGATRFEQIGLSWLFHGFFPVQQNSPCSTCQPASGAQLGVSCSSVDTSSAAGNQSSLGPRWQVNAWTGQFAFPPANPSFSGSIPRRLQASLDDINLTDSFYVEAHAVSPSDAASGRGGNNASYIPCFFAGTPADYIMFISGGAVPEEPAIMAWRVLDPQVVINAAQFPGEGTFYVGSRATQLAGGAWRYEYAVYNLNSDWSAGAFAVPLPDNAPPVNIGFHDVAYTDGDGLNNVTRDGEDWRSTHAGGLLTWETTPFAVNPNANALRWGTMYNFRFDSMSSPTSGQIMLTAWQQPASIGIAAVVPQGSCYANCDGSTVQPVLNVNDFVCFQQQFAAGASYANCDGSTTPPVLNVNDFVCFQQQFATGCP